MNETEKSELLKQAAVLAVERRPEACIGCGFEHNCSTHGCTVINKLVEVVVQDINNALSMMEVKTHANR